MDFFEEKAKDWDERPVPQQISESVGALLRSRLPWSDEMRVMDFGAGTGLIARHVAPLVSEVAAVDISPAMLEKLAQKPELAGKVRTHCRNILETPLDEQFDGVVSAMAMHHVEDIDALLRAFHAHLNPGGFIAVADLDTEDGTFHSPGTKGVFHLGFDRSGLKDRLEAVGFEDVDVHTALEVNKGSGTFSVFFLTAKKAEPAGGG